ncbi:hypothetical protein [Methanoculleus horonobensis]|uniref:hypothetical protein n=1 Tax=Methanoculleus horonobensis TaxID=528314 RepID=UPI0008299D50|nr:hypothetical protein [Methanoculleus horonobensis]
MAKAIVRIWTPVYREETYEFEIYDNSAELDSILEMWDTCDIEELEARLSKFNNLNLINTTIKEVSDIDEDDEEIRKQFSKIFILPETEDEYRTFTFTGEDDIDYPIDEEYYDNLAIVLKPIGRRDHE